MKNLFLVDGVSAIGKSDLLNWIHSDNPHNASIVTKATTRAKHDFELNDSDSASDLEFIDLSEFESRDFDFTYTHGRAHYGFSREELNRHLLRSDNVFAVVRNLWNIKRLIAEYHFLNVVPIFIYFDRHEVEKRFGPSQLWSEAIKARVERSYQPLKDYYRHSDVYREVLINASEDRFNSVIDRLLEKYAGMPSIDPHLIAVLMSFNDDNEQLRDYYRAIQVAAHQLSPNYRCTRVDELPGSGQIGADFQNLVSRARCLIVDLTENKQNVYYELGQAHARGATCIITALAGTEPSFYARQHRVVFYRSAEDLVPRLTAELSRVIRGPAGL